MCGLNTGIWSYHWWENGHVRNKNGAVGMSPEKVKGSPRQWFLSARHATLLAVGGGGGALRDGTKTAARKTSEEEAVIPIL